MKKCRPTASELGTAVAATLYPIASSAFSLLAKENHLLSVLTSRYSQQQHYPIYDLLVYAICPQSYKNIQSSSYHVLRFDS